MTDYDPIQEELKYTALQVALAQKTLDEYVLLKQQSRKNPERYNDLIASMQELHDSYQQRLQDILDGQY